MLDCPEVADRLGVPLVFEPVSQRVGVKPRLEFIMAAALLAAPILPAVTIR